MQSPSARMYSRLVFEKPFLMLFLILLVVGFFAYFTQFFRLDASADALLLEGDVDLEYSRFINNRYGVRDTVLVAYTPEAELFSRETLNHIVALRDELLLVDRVESVDSILNAPVFEELTITQIASYRTVMDPEMDLAVAKEELINSPIFRNAVVSPDGKTAALRVSFQSDEKLKTLLLDRANFRNKRIAEGLTEQEQDAYQQIIQEYAQYSTLVADRQHENIAAIRNILDKYRDNAVIYLGGAPMITDDLVTFVRSDLRNFSLGVLFFIVVALGLIFRRLRWVVLPLTCCAIAGTIMVGLLGFMDWRVTVVSSNFISLLLILTISLTVHLMVRYRELRATRHHSNHEKLLRHSVLSMFKPCLYSVLTTIVAFGSLLVSGISPIISFGWIMVMGVTTSLLVVFTVFPAVMSVLEEDKTKLSSDIKLNLTSALAKLTDRLGNKVLVIYTVVLFVGLTGLSRLEVENSFIDYFREKTEIFQGMTLFDEKLDGTLSFDVVIDLPEEEVIDDGFGDDFGGVAENTDAYWFTSKKMDRIREIHEYLDANPQTGKVLSFGSVIQVAEIINDGVPIDNFTWSVLYSLIPEEMKAIVLDPFVKIDENQVLFNVRVRESDENLRRNELLQQIETGLKEEFGFEDEQVHITGILVLYNNVLQKLYSSQIMTLGVVLFAIMIMFLILFKSLKIAVICIIPNITAAIFVLGVMGWLGIPLDIMTITIAAITVGIGVDDTIHYMHRFEREFHRLGDYRETMFYCHNSIGRAMYYTTMTIVAGFSILALSNFIPTIVFGLLTSIAMMVALVGALTLLPQLLITFQPLGPEKATE